MLPAHLPHVFLANSGAEAVDGALKFARLVTKRAAFVATTKGFHGRTIGALSVTWEPKYREGFQPLLDTTHVPFNDVAALDRAVGDSTAAVILEVVQGESGVNVGTSRLPAGGASDSAASAARCSSSTRSRPASAAPGRWFAVEHAGTRNPTSCAWRRASAAAFPMGALAYTEAVRRRALPRARMAAPSAVRRLACAAGLAALAAYRDERSDRAQRDRSAQRCWRRFGTRSTASPSFATFAGSA